MLTPADLRLFFADAPRLLLLCRYAAISSACRREVLLPRLRQSRYHAGAAPPVVTIRLRHARLC